MRKETAQVYTLCAEPHLFQSNTEQTAHFGRPSISGRSSNPSICFVGGKDMATVPCIDDHRTASSFRVLVVDDYEPFRRFVCSTLEGRPDLHVIGEASDGLEAVQKAEELRPDLILLDIGLPKLNGIEVSHRISKLVPSATVLFLSQENDADVIATALSNGAGGYVLKLDVDRELLPAVESVLRRQRFVSTGVTPPHATPPVN
jgi:CheY-like chemotaxis protein